MVRQLLVLVIILLLTTFLFFIIHGNRKSHEGMANQIVTINGIKITKDTPNKELQDLLQKELKRKANNEQKIKDCQKIIKENNQAKSVLNHEKDAYNKEIIDNQAEIDKNKQIIRNAKTTNQTLTEENKILEKRIAEIYMDFSKLQIEYNSLKKTNQTQDIMHKININLHQQDIKKQQIRNKSKIIVDNLEKIIDITEVQDKVKILQTQQTELTNQITNANIKIEHYENSIKENKDHIKFYQTKIDELKKNIMYLEVKMQDLTSRTKNPGNALSTVSSSNSGA
jgi:chromosome segregation ATPase